jgi:hypothetical protein
MVKNVIQGFWFKKYNTAYSVKKSSSPGLPPFQWRKPRDRRPFQQHLLGLRRFNGASREIGDRFNSIC